MLPSGFREYFSKLMGIKQTINKKGIRDKKYGLVKIFLKSIIIQT
jgi:hypothetical protein